MAETAELGRYRAKNSEISKKLGNAPIRTLRETYGQSFAQGCAGDERLADVLHKLDEASLSRLVRDHEAGKLEEYARSEAATTNSFTEVAALIAGEGGRLFAEAAVIPAEANVLTKAVIRAAERLGIKSNVLARIVGISEPTISRMRKGERSLEPDQKSFELAILFVRLYRSLDGIVGGDDTVAAHWIKNRNTALDGVPLELIQTVSGLMNVIGYLDARRAIV